MTFKKLAEYFRQLEDTPLRLRITAILAELFQKCSDEEIGKICYLSLGRLLPAYLGLEFQMAEKMMQKAVAKAVGLEVEKVAKEYKKTGDLGTVAQAFKSQFGSRENLLFDTREKGELSVEKVYERLMEIAKESGPGSVERKIDKMAALLQDLDELSVRFVVRIPLGKLRLGFSEMTVLDALSWMTKEDKSLRTEYEDAYNVLADIGEIAKIIKVSQNVKNIKPKVGTPIIPALAQRLGSVEEMLEKMQETNSELGKGVVIEPKYDGERLQIHFNKKENKIRIFTRNLENVTVMFPEIVQAIPSEIKAQEVILDSEGIGIDPASGKFVAFQETIKRKRKHGIGQTAAEIPFKCFVFDVMFKDRENLIKTPFFQRRKILETVLPKTNKTLLLTPQLITNDPEKLREFHEEQINKGLEGAMVKKIYASYDPGRRGFTWVKFKQEGSKKGGGLADTIDCVVMGIYQGKGKRTDFGVGAFLVGVLEKDKFVTLSKIGTGLSDEQWRELKSRSLKLKIKEKPSEYEVEKNLIPDSWLKPGLIVEIQADNITKSPLHTAGLALRFPRLIRFREDKSVKQTTSVKEVKRLFGLQYGVVNF